MFALRTLTAAALILAIAGGAFAQGRMDLRGALQRAEADNLELRAVRQQRAIALAGLQTARQVPNPTITFSASRDAPHESVLWSQPIELGGKRGARIAVARQEQRTTELEVQILGRQIRHRTREAFFRVLLTRAQTQQAKITLDLAQQLRDSVEQRYQAGDVAQLEVIQADVELARVRADYELARASERSADAQLAVLLNLPLDRAPDLDGRIEDLPKPVTLGAVTQTALQSNPELQRAAQEVQVEQRRLGLAKTQRVPNLDLQAGTDLNAPPDFQVGPRGQIGMSLPIFYHGQGEVSQSSARLEFLRLSLDAQRTTASARVAAAFFDYRAKLAQSQQYSEIIVPQTVRLEGMAAESYREGKSNLLVVIDAQRKLSDTRKAYLDSLFAAQSAFAALEEVAGEALD
ncbi:MAG TPA: TolC family protein [Terriglobales bacterium]|nr:TolC family protein [Terriglobales bacterium]